MMRPRGWGLLTAAGAAGLVAASLNFMPPLPESLLIGSSIGMVVVGPAGRMVKEALPPRKARAEPAPEAELKRLTQARTRARAEEHERILDNFDTLLSRVEAVDDPEVNKKVTENFERFVERLTRHYPEWDAEGRLRTYVLMKKIADSLNLHNADTYLDMAYRTLMARGAEASEISHITLNGKVERMYRDPENEGTRRLAGTLLLMNRGDDEYAREMVVEAVHLWSDSRFLNLRGDFATVSSLGKQEEESVLDLLEKEMEKAARVKDTGAAKRARDLWMTILVADPRLPRLRSK